MYIHKRVRVQCIYCFISSFQFLLRCGAVVSPDGQQEVEDELREAEGEQHRGLVHGAPLHSRQLPPLEYQAAARGH